MYKRKIGVAYFQKNLNFSELREELENDLSAHVSTRNIPCVGEMLVIEFDKYSWCTSCFDNIQLKKGICEKDIIGNICGKIIQIKRRHERNPVYKCIIYGAKKYET